MALALHPRSFTRLGPKRFRWRCWLCGMMSAHRSLSSIEKVAAALEAHIAERHRGGSGDLGDRDSTIPEWKR